MSPAATRASGRRPDIEQELKDHYSVEFMFHRKVDVDEFDIDKSLHNQARFEPIDERTVELYREAVERGDIFPAVIAHRPGKAHNAKLVIVDGNHRLVAHQRAGKPIDLYEIERGAKPQAIALMTFAFNTRHGRPTSEEERVSQALFLIENGATQDGAAAAVNVARGVLKRAVARANADRRAGDVGVDMREWDALNQSVKARLLNISTDEGFHGAVHLTYAAKLGIDEVFELVQTLNTSKSAAKQRQIIKSETERYSDRLQENAGGVLRTGDRRPMTARARVGMVLGQITALPDDFVSLSKGYSPGEREEAASRLIDASEKLRKLAHAVNPDLV